MVLVMAEKHGIIAFDGLSLSGKSKLAQMLLERSPNAVLIRENSLDPYREMTSHANKTFKEPLSYGDQMGRIKAAYPRHKDVIDAAQSSVKELGLEGPTPDKHRPAT